MVLGVLAVAVLVMGVFWKRGTNQAALATFSVGCAIGLVYFILDMKSVGRAILENPAKNFGGLVTDPLQGLGIPFMIVGPILCALCFVTYITVSLMTPPPPKEQLENACWGSPLKAVTQSRISGMSDPRVIAMLLFGLMIGLYAFLK